MDTTAIDVACKLLEVLEKLDRVFSAVKPSTDTKKNVESFYKEAYTLWLSVFAKIGIH